MNCLALDRQNAEEIFTSQFLHTGQTLEAPQKYNSIGLYMAMINFIQPCTLHVILGILFLSSISLFTSVKVLNIGYTCSFVSEGQGKAQTCGVRE